jgi:hypothetical protein
MRQVSCYKGTASKKSEQTFLGYHRGLGNSEIAIRLVCSFLPVVSLLLADNLSLLLPLNCEIFFLTPYSRRHFCLSSVILIPQIISEHSEIQFF